MVELSYRSYVCVQLWAYLFFEVFGIMHPLGIMGFVLMYATLAYNWRSVDRWMSLPNRHANGQFMKGRVEPKFT